MGAFAVDIAAVDNKMRGLVAEALAKQGRSLRAQTSVENMVLRAVKSCGAADDLAENVAVTVSPENPTPGQAYTTVTDYTIREGVTITSGKAYYKATLSGFPIVNQSDDLCEDLKTDHPLPPVRPRALRGDLGHAHWRPRHPLLHHALDYHHGRRGEGDPLPPVPVQPLS